MSARNWMSGGKTITWPKCIAMGILTLSICIQVGLSSKSTIWLTLFMVYLPSYLDGSEHTGERYWPWFAAICARLMNTYKATLELEAPIDPKKSYIFCCHPHGVLSAHHGVMLAGTSKPCM